MGRAVGNRLLLVLSSARPHRRRFRPVGHSEEHQAARRRAVPGAHDRPNRHQRAAAGAELVGALFRPLRRQATALGLRDARRHARTLAQSVIARRA